MKNFNEYIKQFNPCLDRTNTKFYSEMQWLAYNLIKYLNMNGDPDNTFQGNWNFTYLKENMTEDDFTDITRIFMSSIPLGRLKEMIDENFAKHFKEYLVNIQYKELLDKYNRLKDSIKTIIDIVEDDKI